MIQPLTRRLQQIAPLTAEEQKLLHEIVPYRVYQKDEFILMEGDVSNQNLNCSLAS
ncbi:MAG: hypothetical protein AB8G22_13705 [Saprospiraceae bacterium]